MFKFMEIKNLQPVFIKGYLVALITVLKKSDDVCTEYKNTPIYETKCESITTEKMSERVEDFIKDFIINTSVGYLEKHPDSTLNVLKEDLLEIKILEEHDLLYVKYKNKEIYSVKWASFKSYTDISKDEYPDFEKIIRDIRDNLTSP